MQEADGFGQEEQQHGKQHQRQHASQSDDESPTMPMQQGRREGAAGRLPEAIEAHQNDGDKAAMARGGKFHAECYAVGQRATQTNAGDKAKDGEPV